MEDSRFVGVVESLRGVANDPRHGVEVSLRERAAGAGPERARDTDRPVPVPVAVAVPAAEEAQRERRGAGARSRAGLRLSGAVLARGDAPDLAENGTEIETVDELHGVVGDAVRVADIEDGNDVWVAHARGGLRFPKETLARGRIEKRGARQHFQRDLSPERELLGLEDHAHAAASELVDEAVVSHTRVEVSVSGRQIARPSSHRFARASEALEAEERLEDRRELFRAERASAGPPSTCARSEPTRSAKYGVVQNRATPGSEPHVPFLRVPGGRQGGAGPPGVVHSRVTAATVDSSSPELRNVLSLPNFGHGHGHEVVTRT